MELKGGAAALRPWSLCGCCTHGAGSRGSWRCWNRENGLGLQARVWRLRAGLGRGGRKPVPRRTGAGTRAGPAAGSCADRGRSLALPGSPPALPLPCGLPQGGLWLRRDLEGAARLCSGTRCVRWTERSHPRNLLIGSFTPPTMTSCPPSPVEHSEGFTFPKVTVPPVLLTTRNCTPVMPQTQNDTERPLNTRHLSLTRGEGSGGMTTGLALGSVLRLTVLAGSRLR